MSGILINDNSTAVEAYNNLDATSDMLSSAVNKLSSGLQIQTANTAVLIGRHAPRL